MADSVHLDIHTASQETKWTYQEHNPLAGPSNNVPCFNPPVNHIVFATCPANVRLSFCYRSISLNIVWKLFPGIPFMLINGGSLCMWHPVDEAST